MLEKEIEQQMRDLVKKRGGLFYKFVSPGNRGVPDRIVITPAGEVWFVELKQPAGRLAAWLAPTMLGLCVAGGALCRYLHASTALATAGNLPLMAAAFRDAISAGRKAYRAGLGRVLARGAAASDPLTGFLRD